MKTMTTLPKISLQDVDETSILAETLLGFMATCLPHYLTLQAAEFHFTLSDTLENDTSGLIEIVGFRGSAKTTFSSLAFPLFAALSGRYKFIVIINDTSEQVEVNIANIRHELENNPLIHMMYPDVQLGETWSKGNLLLSNGVRIIGRSRGQNIRGIRHRQYRPDLIIVDDPENIRQVRTKENRDRTMEWFSAEVVPAAQENGSKLIVIGNLLHNDGFMARLSRNPLFKVIRIPLIDENGNVTWKAKYPTQEALDIQRQKVGEIAFAREYLLKIISPDEQIIKAIATYTTLPEIISIAIGVDLAISKKATADYTSICVVGEGKDGKYYVLDLVNERLSFNETMAKVYAVWKKHKELYPQKRIRLGFEDVAYQKSAIEEFQNRYKIIPEAIKQNTDKRAKLETLSPYFEQEQVLLKERGQEMLYNQLLYFGIEPHDDTVDAFEMALRLLINKSRPQVLWV